MDVARAVDANVGGATAGVTGGTGNSTAQPFNNANSKAVAALAATLGIPATALNTPVVTAFEQELGRLLRWLRTDKDTTKKGREVKMKAEVKKEEADTKNAGDGADNLGPLPGKDENGKNRSWFAGQLCEIWSKYQSRLHPVYFYHKLISTGDYLFRQKEYETAQRHCYGRYLDRFRHGDEVFSLANVSHYFKETGAAVTVLTLRAIYSDSMCRFHMVSQVDPKLQSARTRAVVFDLLRRIRAAMQVAIPMEHLSWLVYNGTINIYVLCRPLMTVGLCGQVVEFLLWASLCMESVIPLVTIKYLKWRVQLYIAVCQCYFEIRAGDHAEAFARRALEKIRELETLEGMEGQHSTVPGARIAFQESRAKLNIMVFRKAIFKERDPPTLGFRYREVEPGSAYTNQIESLLTDLFEERQWMVRGMVEAMGDVQARIGLKSWGTGITTDADVFDPIPHVFTSCMRVMGMRTKAQLIQGYLDIMQKQMSQQQQQEQRMLVASFNRQTSIASMQVPHNTSKNASIFDVRQNQNRNSQFAGAYLNADVNLLSTETNPLNDKPDWIDEFPIPLLFRFATYAFQYEQSDCFLTVAPLLTARLERRRDSTSPPMIAALRIMQAVRALEPWKNPPAVVQPLQPPPPPANARNNANYATIVGVCENSPIQKAAMETVAAASRRDRELRNRLATEAKLAEEELRGFTWSRSSPGGIAVERIAPDAQVLELCNTLRAVSLSPHNGVFEKCPDLVLDAVRLAWRKLRPLVARVSGPVDTTMPCALPDAYEPVIEPLQTVYHVISQLGVQRFDPMLSAEVGFRLALLLEGQNKLTDATRMLRAVFKDTAKYLEIVSLDATRQLHVTADPQSHSALASLASAQLMQQSGVSSVQAMKDVRAPLLPVTDRALHTLHVDILSALFRIELRVTERRDDEKERLAHAALEGKKPRKDATAPQSSSSKKKTLDKVLSSECRRNPQWRAVLLIETAASMRVTSNAAIAEQARLLSEASTAITQAHRREEKHFAVCQKLNSYASDKTPPPPIVVARGPTWVVLKTQRFVPEGTTPGHVHTYRVFGKCAAGTSGSTKVSIIDSGLPGTGEEVPATHGCEFRITGLLPNEKYVFALAAYTPDGTLVGGSIGATGKSVVTAYPLPTLALWAHLCRAAYGAQQNSVAESAASILWNHFVLPRANPLGEADPVEGDEYAAQPERLNLENLAAAGTSMIRNFAESVLAWADLTIAHNGLFCMPFGPKVDARVSLQRDRLVVARRVLVAMDVAGTLNDHELLAQAAVRCYGVLAPIVHARIAPLPAIRILGRCLCALSELPIVLSARIQKTLTVPAPPVPHGPKINIPGIAAHYFVNEKANGGVSVGAAAAPTNPNIVTLMAQPTGGFEPDGTGVSARLRDLYAGLVFHIAESLRVAGERAGATHVLESCARFIASEIVSAKMRVEDPADDDDQPEDTHTKHGATQGQFGPKTSPPKRPPSTLILGTPVAAPPPSTLPSLRLSRATLRSMAELTSVGSLDRVNSRAQLSGKDATSVSNRLVQTQAAELLRMQQQNPGGAILLASSAGTADGHATVTPHGTIPGLGAIVTVPIPPELQPLEEYIHVVLRESTPVLPPDLTGDGVVLLLSFLSATPAEQGFLEIQRFKKNARYVEFICRVAEKGLVEGRSEQVSQWCEETLEWVKRRNEDVLNPNLQPEDSDDDIQSDVSRMVPGAPGVKKRKGPASDMARKERKKEIRKKGVAARPARLRMGNGDSVTEDAYHTAVSVLQQALPLYWREHRCRKRLRGILAQELKWHSQLTLVHGMCLLDSLVNKLEKRAFVDAMQQLQPNQQTHASGNDDSAAGAGTGSGAGGGSGTRPASRPGTGHHGHSQQQQEDPQASLFTRTTNPLSMDFEWFSLETTGALFREWNEAMTVRRVRARGSPDQSDYRPERHDDDLLHILLQFSRAAVFALRVRRRVLVHNACRHLFNCARIFSLGPLGSCASESGSSYQALASVAWLPFYVATDALLDTMAMDAERVVEGGSSGPGPDPERWVRSFVLHTLETLHENGRWHRLVDIGTRYNDLTGNKFSDAVMPLLLHAQASLNPSRSLSAGGQMVKLIHQAAEHGKSKSYSREAISRSRCLLVQYLAGRTNPSGVAGKESGSKSLVSTQSRAGRFGGRSDDAAFFGFGQEDTRVDKEDPAERAAREELTSRLASMGADQYRGDVELAPLSVEDAGVVIQSYERTIEMLRVKAETRLLWQAQNECGDFAFHLGRPKTATRLWMDALDSLLGEKMGISRWREVFVPTGGKPSLDGGAHHRAEIECLLLARCGVRGCLSAGILASKIAKYGNAGDLQARYEGHVFAGFLFGAVFKGSLPHPTHAVDFATYVPDELFPGVDIFADRFECSPQVLLDGLESTAAELIRNGHYMESLPLISLYEHVSALRCRDIFGTVNARVLRIEALANLDLFSEAVATMVDVLQGKSLPRAGIPLQRLKVTDATFASETSAHAAPAAPPPISQHIIAPPQPPIPTSSPSMGQSTQQGGGSSLGPAPSMSNVAQVPPPPPPPPVQTSQASQQQAEPTFGPDAFSNAHAVGDDRNAEVVAYLCSKRMSTALGVLYGPYLASRVRLVHATLLHKLAETTADLERKSRKPLFLPDETQKSAPVMKRAESRGMLKAVGRRMSMTLLALKANKSHIELPGSSLLLAQQNMSQVNLLARPESPRNSLAMVPATPDVSKTAPALPVAAPPPIAVDPGSSHDLTAADFSTSIGEHVPPPPPPPPPPQQTQTQTLPTLGPTTNTLTAVPSLTESEGGDSFSLQAGPTLSKPQLARRKSTAQARGLQPPAASQPSQPVVPTGKKKEAKTQLLQAAEQLLVVLCAGVRDAARDLELELRSEHAGADGVGAGAGASGDHGDKGSNSHLPGSETKPPQPQFAMPGLPSPIILSRMSLLDLDTLCHAQALLADIAGTRQESGLAVQICISIMSILKEAQARLRSMSRPEKDKEDASETRRERSASAGDSAAKASRTAAEDKSAHANATVDARCRSNLDGGFWLAMRLRLATFLLDRGYTEHSKRQCENGITECKDANAPHIRVRFELLRLLVSLQKGQTSTLIPDFERIVNACTGQGGHMRYVLVASLTYFADLMLERERLARVSPQLSLDSYKRAESIVLSDIHDVGNEWPIPFGSSSTTVNGTPKRPNNVFVHGWRHLARMKQRLGIAYARRNDFALALESMREGLDVCQQAVWSMPHIKAQLLLNLGRVHARAYTSFVGEQEIAFRGSIDADAIAEIVSGRPAAKRASSVDRSRGANPRASITLQLQALNVAAHLPRSMRGETAYEAALQLLNQAISLATSADHDHRVLRDAYLEMSSLYLLKGNMKLSAKALKDAASMSRMLSVLSRVPHQLASHKLTEKDLVKIPEYAAAEVVESKQSSQAGGSVALPPRMNLLTGLVPNSPTPRDGITSLSLACYLVLLQRETRVCEFSNDGCAAKVRRLHKYLREHVPPYASECCAPDASSEAAQVERLRARQKDAGTVVMQWYPSIDWIDMGRESGLEDGGYGREKSFVLMYLLSAPAPSAPALAAPTDAEKPVSARKDRDRDRERDHDKGEKGEKSSQSSPKTVALAKDRTKDSASALPGSGNSDATADEGEHGVRDFPASKVRALHHALRELRREIGESDDSAVDAYAGAHHADGKHAGQQDKPKESAEIPEFVKHMWTSCLAMLEDLLDTTAIESAVRTAFPAEAVAAVVTKADVVEETVSLSSSGNGQFEASVAAAQPAPTAVPTAPAPKPTLEFSRQMVNLLEAAFNPTGGVIDRNNELCAFLRARVPAHLPMGIIP